MKLYPCLYALDLCLTALFALPAYTQECDLRLEYNQLLHEEQLATRKFSTTGLIYGMRGSGPNQFVKVKQGEQQAYYFIATLIFPSYRKTLAEDSVVFYFTDGSRLKVFNIVDQKPIKRTINVLYAQGAVYNTPFLCNLKEEDVQTLARKKVKKITFYIGSEMPLYTESNSRREQKRYDKIAGRKTFSIKHVNPISQKRLQQMAQCIL